MTAKRGSGSFIRSHRAVLAAALAAALPAAALLPAASTQAAVAGSGAAAAAGTWGKAQPLPGMAALDKSAQIESAAIWSLSCGSPGNCAAGGYYTDSAGHQQAFVASEVGGTWHNAIEVPGTAALNTGGNALVEAVSCAASGYCAAGGYYSSPGVDRQAFLVTGVDGMWGPAREVPGTASLNKGGQATVIDVSCPSAGSCAAGGGYEDAGQYDQAFVVSEHDGTWQDARQVPGTASPPFSTRDPAIASISCPSAGNCSASGDVDTPDTSFVVSEKNGTWHRAQLVPGLDALNTGSYAEVADVSCPAAGNCGAGGLYLHLGRDGHPAYHAFVVSEVNGTWQKTREVTGFAAFHGHQPGISSLSCASPGNCSAVGTASSVGPEASKQSDNQGFVVSEHDGTWGQPELAAGIPVISPLKGFVRFSDISCRAPGDCSTGGYYDGYDHHGHAFVLGETDGTWGSAEQVPGILALDKGGNSAIDALSCATPAHCSASGYFYRKNARREYLFVVSER